ncbi:MAG: hypothetical protein Tsb0010_03380 [Parvularculaceae bacterium]
MATLLKIGEFARAAQVTVKTLRFYADQGLLPPAYVDPETGYRYFAVAQLKTLNRILNLRQAGFAIAEIAAILDGAAAPEIAQAFEEKRRALLAEQARIETRLKLVDALAQSFRERADHGLSAVRLKAVEPTLARTLRRRTPTLGAPVTEMFETVEREVGAAKARAEASPFLLFHEYASPQGAGAGAAEQAAGSALDLEVCIPVKEDTPFTDGVRLVPGDALSCSVSYTGDYAQTAPVRDLLLDWLAGAGLRPAGPLREVYHRFGADQRGYSLPGRMLAANTDDYITEIQLAVSPQENSEN